MRGEHRYSELPDLYTLTLALSRTRERGCGPGHHWLFSCSGSIRFRISTWIPVLALETGYFNGTAMVFKILI
jgi:hypothetical protein